MHDVVPENGDPGFYGGYPGILPVNLGAELRRLRTGLAAVLIQLLYLDAYLLEPLVEFPVVQPGDLDLLVFLGYVLPGSPDRVGVQGYLQFFPLVRVFQELPCLLALFPERSDTALQFPCNIPESGQVVLCLDQFSLGFRLPEPELSYPGSLLEHLSPVGAAALNDLRDPALAYDGIPVSSEAGVHEHLSEISEPDGGPVEQVLAVTAPVIPPGNGDLGPDVRQAAVGVVKTDGDLREAHGIALRRPAEDDVFHLAAAQRFCGLLSEHPLHCVAYIALSAPVGSHYTGEPSFEAEPCFVWEGFESLDLDILKIHLLLVSLLEFCYFYAHDTAVRDHLDPDAPGSEILNVALLLARDLAEQSRFAPHLHALRAF